MTNPLHIQQGDCLLRIVTALPEGCKPLKTKTLAVGSGTGHSHSFTSTGNTNLFEAPDGRVFAENNGDTDSLLHQEHKPVTLQPGQIAEHGTVREKDWFTEMVRPVVD